MDAYFQENGAEDEEFQGIDEMLVVGGSQAAGSPGGDIGRFQSHDEGEKGQSQKKGSLYEGEFEGEQETVGRQFSVSSHMGGNRVMSSQQSPPKMQ